MKICIVDDHYYFRQTMKFSLAMFWKDCQIDEADDGVVFVNNVKEGKNYDLVVMDIKMKEMDGLEATIKALDYMPELKIVIVTMNWNEEYLQKLHHAGAKGFITKFSDQKDFQNAFQTVLGGGLYFQGRLY